MKRLSINDIAKASLRTGKRAYLSLAIGIFLSIFLVTSMFFGVQGIFLAQEKERHENNGCQDIILMENPVTDERLMSDGHFAELGHAYVTAEIDETGKYIGYYDETAQDILSLRCMEGRMPEKPGEIALERRLIEQQRMEIEVGDRVTLPLRPVDGAAEEREFTLVGILNERSERLNTSEEYPSQIPAAVIHPDEPLFATGRVSMIRIMTISEKYSPKATILAWTRLPDGSRGNLFNDFYVYDSGIMMRAYYVDDLTATYVSSYLSTQSILVILLAVSLLIACGVGIAQAMNSRLTHRSEEVGLLRAVGATKRQIRRIFGREAWILMLLITPFAVAAGCAAVWVIARAWPEQVIFRMSGKLLAPVILMSAGCILVFSRAPLYRASSIMPMSVLRDTAVLRKAKRIRPKKQFRAQDLISGRMLRLYPSRQIGSMVLVLLMLICVMLTGYISRIDAGASYKSEQAAFRLWGYTTPNGSGVFDYVQVVPRSDLSEQDLAQMARLPKVESVRSRIESQRILLKMDEPHEYFRSEIKTVWHLMDESHQVIMYDGTPFSYEEVIRNAKQEHQKMQQLLGTEQLLIPYELRAYTLTEQQAEILNRYAAQGEVNLEALDAGREVLVVAPDLYWYQTKWGTFNYSEDEPKTYQSKVKNDAFFAGQQLDFIQISCDEDDLPDNYYDISDVQAAEQAKVFEGSVRVGAVLDHHEELSELGLPHDVMYILTTEKGLKAMGLERGWIQEVFIGLSGEVDMETEQYLEERLEIISMRGSGYLLFNHLESIREEEQAKRQMILSFGCMTLVFLVVSISLIAGNVTRRIRADERMIGMLRAVGADRRVLRGCYSRQITVSILTALGIGGLIACIAVPLLQSQTRMLGSALPASLALMAAFAGLCAAACFGALSRTISAVTERSIVDNIREL
ncbi:MAG: FtsX-like permease family protein [Clostridia bacterium]|nr:FtsX-like permease family protein [Clostridia bacterium]